MLFLKPVYSSHSSNLQIKKISSGLIRVITACCEHRWDLTTSRTWQARLKNTPKKETAMFIICPACHTDVFTSIFRISALTLIIQQHIRYLPPISASWKLCVPVPSTNRHNKRTRPQEQERGGHKTGMEGWGEGWERTSFSGFRIQR